MIYWSVEPSIISGAQLEYPAAISQEVETYSTVLLLSNFPGKLNSIAVKIHKHSINNDIKEPRIIIDKSILGSLTFGDKVIIKSFNPPVAKQVIIVIDSSYALVEGDYGNKIVNPAINGQIIDVGQDIEFMYGTNSFKIVTAQVKATFPKAPTIVNENTIFIVEKASRAALAKLRITADSSNGKRAKEYFEQLEEENFEILASIRNDTANKLEKTFTFAQTRPKSIYESFKQILGLKTYKFIQDQIEIIGDNTLASILAIPKTAKGTAPTYSIEFKLSSSLKQGVCLLTGYSASPETINSVLTDIEHQLKKMSIFLKDVPQAIPDTCQGCSNRLNLQEQNEKGVVICSSCRTPNILPFALRK